MRHLKRTLRNLLLGAVVVVPAVLADPAMQHFLSAHAVLAGYLGLAAALLETAIHAFHTRAGAGGA